ncbi:ABC transporter ATP-binding protein [Roseibium sp. SCP14]|uniref:ABC transporter ATP-binding protein n=1 Tax=Roseibium sp. SCP14 TaxID=3141375 RepID=UPI0033377002
MLVEPEKNINHQIALHHAHQDETKMQPLISMKGIHKSYGRAVAIERLDLDIDEGKFIAIMGPSGCGKSTLLRCLAGMEELSGGKILRQGIEINDLPIWERDTPLVWQSLALFPFLTVLENVEFGLRMKGVGRGERRERALRWLKRLQLEDHSDRGVDQLSGGQRQRVALARCLVTEPSVLLLDEPLSALDAHLSVRMQGELKRLQRELGITFIYVTHSHSEAFSMADQVVIMNEGRIEQIGAPEEIYLRPATPFVARFLGGSNIIECKARERNSGEIILESTDGSFKCDSKVTSNVSCGDKVNLIIRADQISVTAEAGWAENEIYCQVIGEEFVGALVNLRLETSSGTPIIVQLQQRDMEALDIEIGGGVNASWHPEDGHIINA